MTNDANEGQMLAAMNALRDGDLSFRLPEAPGTAGEIAEAFNDVVELNAGLNRA